MRRITGATSRAYVTPVPPDAAARATLQRCSPTLALTGERTLPGIPAENYWFRRHEAAYHALVAVLSPARWCWRRAAARGTARTCSPSVARPVVGLDYDAAAVGHVGRRVPAGRAGAGNLVALPLRRRRRRRGGDACRSSSTSGTSRGSCAECAPGPAARRDAAGHHPEPADLHPRLGATRPMNPFHDRELDAAELADAARRRRLRDQPAARAAPRPAAAPRSTRLYGSLVAAQLAGPPATWDRRAAPCSSPRSGRATSCSRRDDLDSCLDLLAVAGPCLTPRRRAEPVGTAASCCTPTCPGWRTTGPGRSARSGCTRRGPAPTCRCSRCSTGWPPRAAATCSPSA